MASVGIPGGDEDLSNGDLAALGLVAGCELLGMVGSFVTCRLVEEGVSGSRELCGATKFDEANK
jgi:hypothetical protein